MKEHDSGLGAPLLCIDSKRAPSSLSGISSDSQTEGQMEAAVFRAESQRCHLRGHQWMPQKDHVSGTRHEGGRSQTCHRRPGGAKRHLEVSRTQHAAALSWVLIA